MCQRPVAMGIRNVDTHSNVSNVLSAQIHVNILDAQTYSSGLQCQQYTCVQRFSTQRVFLSGLSNEYFETVRVPSNGNICLFVWSCLQSSNFAPNLSAPNSDEGFLSDYANGICGSVVHLGQSRRLDDWAVGSCACVCVCVCVCLFKAGCDGDCPPSSPFLPTRVKRNVDFLLSAV